jgi:hypothetical protein
VLGRFKVGARVWINFSTRARVLMLVLVLVPGLGLEVWCSLVLGLG